MIFSFIFNLLLLVGHNADNFAMCVLAGLPN